MSDGQRKNETSKNTAYILPNKADGGLSIGLSKTMVELTIITDKQQKKESLTDFLLTKTPVHLT